MNTSIKTWPLSVRYVFYGFVFLIIMCLSSIDALKFRDILFGKADFEKGAGRNIDVMLRTLPAQMHISIIVPCIKEDLLTNIPNLMRSTDNQRVLPLEVVVVVSGIDDKSCQSLTQAMLASNKIYKMKLQCILELQNQAKSRNQGILLSRGNWVSFIDADDEMHPSRLETIAKHILTESELRLVLHGYSRDLAPIASNKYDVLRGEAIFDQEVATRNRTSWLFADAMHSQASVRRDVLLHVKFRTEPAFYRAEDSWFVRDVVCLLGRHQGKMVFDRAPLGVHIPRERKQPLGSVKVGNATAAETT